MNKILHNFKKYFSFFIAICSAETSLKAAEQISDNMNNIEQNQKNTLIGHKRKRSDAPHHDSEGGEFSSVSSSKKVTTIPQFLLIKPANEVIKEDDENFTLAFNHSTCEKQTQISNLLYKELLRSDLQIRNIKRIIQDEERKVNEYIKYISSLSPSFVDIASPLDVTLKSIQYHHVYSSAMGNEMAKNIDNAYFRISLYSEFLETENEDRVNILNKYKFSIEIFKSLSSDLKQYILSFMDESCIYVNENTTIGKLIRKFSHDEHNKIFPCFLGKEIHFFTADITNDIKNFLTHFQIYPKVMGTIFSNQNAPVSHYLNVLPLNGIFVKSLYCHGDNFSKQYKFEDMLNEFPHLEHLTIYEPSAVINSSAFPEHTRQNLKSLFIEDSQDLQELFLKDLPKLEILSVQSCEELLRLNIRNCPHLTELLLGRGAGRVLSCELKTLLIHQVKNLDIEYEDVIFFEPFNLFLSLEKITINALEYMGTHFMSNYKGREILKELKKIRANSRKNVKILVDIEEEIYLKHKRYIPFKRINENGNYTATLEIS